MQRVQSTSAGLKSDDRIFWALKWQKIHWKIIVLSNRIRDAHYLLRSVMDEYNVCWVKNWLDGQAQRVVENGVKSS